MKLSRGFIQHYKRLFFRMRTDQIFSSAGFTLIEIVLVIALIGVAATTVITLIDPVGQFRKTRDAQRKTDLRQLQSAFELYRADQGAYPVSMPACGTALKVGATTYIQKVPCDPRNTGQFKYNFTGDGISYTLISCLENVNDPQKDSTNNSTYCTGGTANSSYTLTNP